MRAITLIFSFVIAFPTAHAEESVWNTMSKGQAAQGKVKEVKRDGANLTVTYEAEDFSGQKVTRTLPVCKTADQSQTEVWLAADVTRQEDKLAQAKAADKAFEFHTGSMWDGCLRLGN